MSNDTKTFDILLGAAALALLGGIGLAAYKSRAGFLGAESEAVDDAVNPLVWPQGHTINGRWQLGAPLGKGGMGVVFAARDLEDGNEVAIKLPLTPAVWGSLEDETVLTARAGPGAVRVYGLGHDDETGMPFVVMERLYGQTLYDRRRQGPLGSEEVIDDMRAALASIALMHDNGVIHRDIKPTNLFKLADGRGQKNAAVKVIDFGLAQPIGTSSAEGEGTVGYAPPEQIPQGQYRRQGNVKSLPSADIYSTGATAWALLSDSRNADSGVACEPTLDGDVLPNQTPMMSAVVARAIQCDPDKRWTSANAMRDKLEAFRPKLLMPAGGAATAQGASLQSALYSRAALGRANTSHAGKQAQRASRR